MTRDELYRSVLEKAEALDPESSGAARSVEELRDALSQLQSGEMDGEPKAKGKTAPPPQGPFPPSQKPSPESEQEKRRKATEDRFPSGGPLEKGTQTASLQGVPEEWIASSCDRAQAELKRFDELTKKTPVDRKAVDASLEKLGSVIRGMSNPPPPK